MQIMNFFEAICDNVGFNLASKFKKKYADTASSNGADKFSEQH